MSDDIRKLQIMTQVKEVGNPDDRILEFVASTETPDRVGDIVDVAGWQTDNYLAAGGKGNPVFAWAHDYDHPAIGKTISITKDLRQKALIIRVQFMKIEDVCSDPNHPSEPALFADTIYHMYKNGYQSAVSVGFRAIKFNPRDDDAVNDLPIWQRGMHFLEVELLEVSAVLVPCNPEALVSMRGMKSFRPEGLKLMEGFMMEKKTAIPFKHYALADEDTTWDAGKVVKDSDTDDLKIICTWYDGSKKPDELTKSDFKLPHHMGSEDGYKTVWNGVKAAMGALFGARGGTTIPKDEQESCYNHLAKHYKEFGKDAPEWGKSYSAEELKELFGEEKNMSEQDEKIKALEARIVSLEGQHQKSGAKFSQETKDNIQKVVDALKAAHKAIKGCHESLEKMIAEEGSTGTEEPGANAGGSGEGTGTEKPGSNVDDGKGLSLDPAMLEEIAKALP